MYEHGRKKKPDLEITELFLCKCGKDWSRTFVGTIVRYTEADGSKVIVGRIPVEDRIVFSRGRDKNQLGHRLDILVFLILERHFHDMPASKSVIGGYEIYNN